MITNSLTFEFVLAGIISFLDYSFFLDLGIRYPCLSNLTSDALYVELVTFSDVQNSIFKIVFYFENTK